MCLASKTSSRKCLVSELVSEQVLIFFLNEPYLETARNDFPILLKIYFAGNKMQKLFLIRFRGSGTAFCCDNLMRPSGYF